MAKTSPEFTLESIGHDVKSILKEVKETRDCVFGNGDIGLKMKVDRLTQASKLWGSLRLVVIVAVVTTAVQVGFQKWGN